MLLVMIALWALQSTSCNDELPTFRPWAVTVAKPRGVSRIRHQPRILLAAASPPPAEKVSVMATQLSIVKGIVGAGIFSLSVGLVTGPGLVPACALAVILGAASAWTFYLVGRAAADTGCTTNKELWAHTVGADSAWLYDFFVAVLCLGGLMQFTATMSQLVGWVGRWLSHICFNGGEATSSAGRIIRRLLADSSYETRLVLITSLVLPLCLANDLNALRHATAIGGAGIAYAVILIAVRVMDGSYRPGGIYASAQALPVTNVWGVNFSGLAAFLGCLNTAFNAHLNIPRFYHEMCAPSATGRSQGGATRTSKVALFRHVVFSSFMLAVLATVIVMACGYLLFGDACDGVLLNNFAVNDHGAALLRIATLFSVLGVHPITFLGLRDALAPLLVYKLNLLSETGLRLLICASVFALSLLFRDVATIIAVRGVLFGTMVVYCLPCIVHLCSERGQASGRADRGLHLSLLTYGALMAVVGTACVLSQRKP